MLGKLAFSYRIDDVTVSKTTYEPNMMMQTHVHRLPYVSLILEGSYTEHRSELPCQLYRDMLVFHPAGEVHADCVHDGSATTVNFEYHSGDFPSDLICAQGPDVDRLSAHLLPVLARGGSRLQEAILSITEFIRARAPSSEPSQQMLRAREALEEIDRRSVTSLAEELGIHRVHLHRTFKQAYGKSLRAHSTNKRLAAAAKLLVETSSKVAQVAADCGYYDQSHFCREFKTLIGMSPSRYRRIFSP